MKNKIPKIISRTLALLAVAVIATFATTHNAGAQLYTDPSGTGEWISARWSTSTNGPFTSIWTGNADSIFLSGNNYTFGALTAGTSVGNITVQSNATVKLTESTFTLGTSQNVRTITVETNAVLDFDLQQISTTAGFIKEGSGVFALAGNSSYRNGFTLNEGTVVVLARQALGAGVGTLTLHNGIIAANADQVITNRTGGAFITGNIQIGALSNNYAANARYLINDDANISFMDNFSLDEGMRTLTIGGNGVYTFMGVISDGGLTVDMAPGATGRIALLGANTYAGGTVINSGAILQLGTDTSTGSVVGNITNNGTLAIYRSNNSYSLDNLVSGSGSLVKLGTKTVSIVADNTYTGDTVISEGVLSLGDGGTTGSVAGGINIVSGTLKINRGDTFTMTNAISGDGILLQSGAGTTILLGNNTYAGSTVISNSTLQVGDGGTSGTLGGTGINIGPGGSLVINRSDNVTLDQVITNNVSGGSFVQLGSGTTTLTGISGSVFAGGILVSNGALQLGDGTQAFSLSGGNITNNSILIWNRDSSGGNVSNAISGTGTFIKMGSGILYVLTNSSYTGGTIISNGILALGSQDRYATVEGDINIASADATLRVSRGDTFTMTNQISGAGKFVQFGTGTLILTADNTYTGTTTISNGGVLQIGDGGTSGTAGTGGINITNAASQLVVNRSNAITLTNTISGAGQFAQAGNGVTTLASTNNTFTGATTVSAGTLELKATTGAALNATASVTISSGATLLLSKSDQVNNAATVTLSGGTIKRASGVSEIFGNLDLTTASTLDYGSGTEGTLTFGTYTPSSLLTVDNFFYGNKLVFSSNLTGQIEGYFDFDHAFTTDWNGSTFTITSIPEPSAYAAAAALIALMLLRCRAKRA